MNQGVIQLVFDCELRFVKSIEQLHKVVYGHVIDHFCVGFQEIDQDGWVPHLTETLCAEDTHQESQSFDLNLFYFSLLRVISFL